MTGCPFPALSSPPVTRTPKLGKFPAWAGRGCPVHIPDTVRLGLGSWPRWFGAGVGDR